MSFAFSLSAAVLPLAFFSTDAGAHRPPRAVAWSAAEIIKALQMNKFDIKEIGVITPYKKQETYLTNLLGVNCYYLFFISNLIFLMCLQLINLKV